VIIYFAWLVGCQVFLADPILSRAHSWQTVQGHVSQVATAEQRNNVDVVYRLPSGQQKSVRVTIFGQPSKGASVTVEHNNRGGVYVPIAVNAGSDPLHPNTTLPSIVGYLGGLIVAAAFIAAWYLSGYKPREHEDL
jgi:hypothetical protein